jgi:hypothetical protein
MKKSILFITSLILCSLAYGQIDPETNARGFVQSQIPAIISPENSSQRSEPGGFQCDQNKFCAVKGTTVYSLTLNGNSITNKGQVLSGNGGSLAYCNNLDGGSYSPTFYSNGSYTKASYYNGSGWTTCTAPPKVWVVNAGGSGNYLYYTAHDSVTHLETGIVRYNGSSYTQIYALPDTSRAITVADLAVDNYGNVWFFVGANSTLVTDTLKVISPTGQLIREYPFSYNTDNAYGCILMNSVIYFALGQYNPDHPYTLVPVSINADQAEAGTPIPMPTESFSDLAGCNAGSPLTVDEIHASSKYSIYPNPVKDVLHIDFIDKPNSSSIVKLLDNTGSVLIQNTASGNNTSIDMSSMPAGVYYLSVNDYTRKIIKK